MADRVYIVIDGDGFIIGERSAYAIDLGLARAEGTVQVPVPAGTLAPRERWRWNGSAWVKKLDNRGHYWYDPADTSKRWTASQPGDQPPAGYTYLVPGVENAPAPTAAQLLREAKEKAIIEVNAERDRALVQPIVYDGSTFDADGRAQDNMKAKLEELRSAAELEQPLAPEQMFWIDYGNALRTFSNETQFRRWLQGLVLTISARGSKAYLDANIKKSQVMAATTVIDVWAAANGANQPLEL